MKNKILHLVFCFGVFVFSFAFLFTSNAKADYPAVLGGGVYFSVPITWCTATDTTKLGTGCASSSTGYVASAPFPNSSFINWCVAIGTDKNGTFCSGFASGYVSNVPFGGSAYSWCTATGVNKTGTFCAADATGYTANSPGWYFQTYSCPSGGTLSGTTCITDNGCAANTCSTTSCWNSTSWVQGAMSCPTPNGCEKTLCSTQACFDTTKWVQGTVNCAVDGVCNSSTNGQTLPSAPTTNLCQDNSLPTVSGTGPWTWTCLGLNGGNNAACSANITDNGCAAITCGTPAPAQTCWNGSAFVTGTKNCPVPNGCETSICSSKTCFNNIIWLTGTKPQSYSNQTCNTIQTLDCSLQSNCGKKNTVTKACIGTDNCTGENNASIPGQCGAGCDTTVSVSCPACPNQATTGTWTEVQP